MAKYSSGDGHKDKGAAKLLDEARGRYTAARDHYREWIRNGREEYQYYAGHQWAPEDEQILRDEQRPAVTFNRAKPLIDAVLGHEANNRNEVRFIPRTHGDAAVNEVLTSVSKYFLDECDAETHISDAFRDTLICGMGWTNTRLSDEKNPDKDLIVERVDPFEMLVDPSSIEPNCADARFIFRRKRFAIEEVKSMWPNWKGTRLDAEWDADDANTHVQHTPRDSYQGLADDNMSTIKDILVLEYQYKHYEVYHLVEIPQENDENDLPLPPKIEEMDDRAFNKRKSKIEESGVNTVRKRRVTIKRCFIIGAEIVQEDEVSPQSFTYHCITGSRDRETGTWFGLMRSLKDPQNWSNKWLAQMMHIINTNATSGINAEESAIDNITEAEAKHARPGRILLFRDGALRSNAVQIVQPMNFPTSVEKLLEYANQSFGDVSGVNQELLGMADREQPGVLEWQRKQSAVSLLAPLFDSLRRYRKMFGRTWLYFIQSYIADGRVARITQDDQQTYTTVTPDIVGDPEVARYDVIVDQQASAPNQKEATWSVLTSLFPAIKDAMDPQTMLLFLEFSPLPVTLIEKLKQLAAEKAQNPPPDPEMQKVEAEKQKMQMQMEMEQQKLQIERQKVEQEIELEKIKLQAEIEADKIRLQHEMMVAQQKAQMDAQLQEQKNQIELAQMQQMGAMEMEKHQQSLSIQQDQAKMDYAKQAMMGGKDGEGNPIDIRSVFGIDEREKASAARDSELIKALQGFGQRKGQRVRFNRGADGRISDAEYH